MAYQPPPRHPPPPSQWRPSGSNPPSPRRPTPGRSTSAGKEWQAEKRTGARAQKGNKPGGAPRWTYEVKWKGNDPKTKKAWPTTFEPPECLVGWGKEMKEVDEACERRALQAPINPFVEAQKAREAAAKMNVA